MRKDTGSGSFLLCKQMMMDFVLVCCWCVSGIGLCVCIMEIRRPVNCCSYTETLDVMFRGAGCLMMFFLDAEH